MFTDWQLETEPAPVPETAGDQSPVLIQLLEEAERDGKQHRQEARRRRLPRGNPSPRPFAYD